MGVSVLVCGGRDYANEKAVFTMLDATHKARGVAVVIHGAASGADSLAAKWADERHVPADPHPAQWDDLSHPDALIRTRRDGKKYDARAGFRRNQEMADLHPSIVLAFPGGNGTVDMVRRASKVGALIVQCK